MAGKPVYEIHRREILKVNPEFTHKKLAGDYTFTTGDACVFSCAFCYVGSLFFREPILHAIRLESGLSHCEIVVRRKDPFGILMSQLFDSWGRPRFMGENEVGKVIFASPNVDCAANLELCRETAEVCRILLTHTRWDIRLLSKSNLLPKIAEALADVPGARERMIFGVSSGTHDDALAASFEIGTAKVSKRIQSIRKLAETGWRCFGMLCPSLPGADLAGILKDLCIDNLEHVWGEVINVRGQSFTNTINALTKGGFHEVANDLCRVCGPGTSAAWEQYSRDTFEHLAAIVQPEKLRFLQYCNSHSIEWWRAQESRGAICLGAAAKDESVNAIKKLVFKSPNSIAYH